MTHLSGGTVDDARALDRAGRRIQVLVLVKASPQPSTQYGDTVCVAGLALEGPLRWVRLYPVPFRYLEGERRFGKYDVISVIVRDAGRDKRPESLKIDAGSIQIGAHVTGWPRRSKWVEPMSGDDTCSILRGVKDDINAQSLAAVRPRQVLKLEITAHGGWTPDQLAKFAAYAAQGDLFRETPAKLLEAPRFKARLKYYCASADCPSHTQTIIDWELTALQHRWRNWTDENLKRIIRERFFDMMYADHKRPVLFLGNQESPVRRGSFTILGSYYPEAGQVAPPDLLF